MRSKNQLKNYHLEDKNYKFLSRKTTGVEEHNPGGASNEPTKNSEKYDEVLHLLEVLEFEPDQIEIVHRILAAIILIGEITFKDADDEGSEVENTDVANNGKHPQNS